MSLTQVERDAIADAVAAKLKPDSGDSGEPLWLKTAGQAVGLIAGVVALAYLLGGGLLGLRLLVERFAPDEVAGVIGNLPRDFLVTTGFLEALGIPLSIGLLAALVAVMNDWPTTTRACDDVKSLWKPWWLVPALIVGGVVPFVLMVVAHDGWRKEFWYLVPLLIATWAALLGGMRTIREAGKDKRHRRAGGVVVGLVVAIVTVPIVIGFGPVLGFPDARVCIRDSDRELEGGLVADTSDRVVLIRLIDAQRGPKRGRTIDSIPADLVERVDSGTLDDLPECEGK